MLSLFPAVPELPEGFRYFPDFISPHEEAELLETVTGLELHPFLFQGFEARRKVKSYGHDYNFDSRTIQKGKEIPGGLKQLIAKVADWLSMAFEDFAEVLVTEYPPGAVINWHRDAPPFDVIAGVSLLSNADFRFRPYDKNKRGRQHIMRMNLERRSLYIIQGEARSEWEHSIAPVTEPRYSVTLRTLRNKLTH